MIYSISFWLHILSYLVWLLAFAASLGYAAQAGRAYETPAEIKWLQRERLATNIGAHFGAVGILLSGSVMAMVPGGPQWGWFNIPLYNWLAVKQLLFIIILILVGFSVKQSIGFRRALSGEDSRLIQPAARHQWRKAFRLSFLIYILVLINTYLGLEKPI